MLFLFSYDISIKVIGYERENNEFALFREDGSAAESPSARCRLVRPGAAMETWPDAHRYRGSSAHQTVGANLGGTAEGFAFRPNSGRRVFLFVFHPRKRSLL